MRWHMRICSVFLILICFDYFLIRRFVLNSERNHHNDLNLNDSISIRMDKSEYTRLYFENDVFYVSSETQITTQTKKVVMFYNLPEYMDKYLKTDLYYTNCDYKNCMLTKNAKFVYSADAIIFYIGIRNKRLGMNPPFNNQQRNPNQVWIFTTIEPPVHYYNTDYMLSSWENQFNWSMLYRLDSDIPNPYGCLLLQTTLEVKNYDNIYNLKGRNALWIVSHCHVSSERRLYVNEMIRHGFDIDIYGGCSSEGRKISQGELESMIPRYKFFLAFENSICNDYISEKFFQNYNHSWIIIVRGGADYHTLLPNKSFINTADFVNVSSLVHYLIKVGNDKKMYESYLRNKDRFVSLRWPMNRNCEICRRLNNLDKFRNTYKNVGKYLNFGQCRRAFDL
ncbi:alpha-(1,3)-fucosyltransferase C-like [Ruditapes philippinarum]|uniref:alpha-(1,3)-fucosyltransferase C-like n=1 Tax=Ruditapes philippinarum TaxID=129788 RepID=UPI00295AB85C|nr:alpha-(1,3)-fucosyltransferase C-like [Ruditapes philippinarum]